MFWAKPPDASKMSAPPKRYTREIPTMNCPREIMLLLCNCDDDDDNDDGWGA
jgi:hypothetical protein